MEVLGYIQGNEITKEWSGSGFIYKNPTAFFNKQGICYIPELTGDLLDDADTYDYSDFLNLAGGNTELAEYIFDSCSWEHPETCADGLWDIGIVYCHKCGYMYDLEDTGICPKCRTAYKE